MGWDNIIKSQGLPIAVTGLLIVFFALTLITVFIQLLPTVLDFLGIQGEAEEPASKSPPQSAANGAVQPEVIAAIGLALHTQAQRTGGAAPR